MVASDLGLPPSAVLPYPGEDVARASIGLASVLVVLGSAPGQLAHLGLAEDRLVVVNPKEDLTDGAQVTVSGRGGATGRASR